MGVAAVDEPCAVEAERHDPLPGHGARKRYVVVDLCSRPAAVGPPLGDLVCVSGRRKTFEFLQRHIDLTERRHAPALDAPSKCTRPEVQWPGACIHRTDSAHQSSPVMTPDAGADRAPIARCRTLFGRLPRWSRHDHLSSVSAAVCGRVVLSRIRTRRRVEMRIRSGALSPSNHDPRPGDLRRSPRSCSYDNARSCSHGDDKRGALP